MASFVQGEYGCVHKPCLQCTSATPGTVSKTMETEEAEDELAQYVMVHAADPEAEFHLGMPTLCDIDNTISNQIALLKCRIGKDVLRNMSQYKLIVMKDGGKNLREYAEEVQSWLPSSEATQQCRAFLKECVRLFRGLHVFQQHGILLNDVKPQNIVYDGSRLNFIDFGITQNKNELMHNLLHTPVYAYDFSILHWNFPWEMAFLNRSKFESITLAWKKQLRQDMTSKSGYYIHLKEYFAHTWIPPENSFLEFDAFIDGVLDEELDYVDVVVQCLATIDSFGLGLTLMNWLHSAETHLEDAVLVAKLQTIFRGMVCQHVMRRFTVDTAQRLLEEALRAADLFDDDQQLQDCRPAPLCRKRARRSSFP